MHVNSCVHDIKCGGIIIDKKRKKILCVLNKLSFLKGEHKWGFPKGHIKENEETWRCAQREIHEETSLYLEKCKFNKSVKIYNNVYYIITMNTEYNNLISYDNQEICKVEWKTLTELKENNYNRDLRVFLNFINNKPLSTLIRLLPNYEMVLNRKKCGQYTTNQVKTSFIKKNRILVDT